MFFAGGVPRVPFGILILLIQIGFAVHAVRTGRAMLWLSLIVFVPLIGCVVYFIAEILPELGRTRTARTAAANISRSLTSARDYRAMVDAVEELPTADNRRALAEELIRRQDFSAALTLYELALAPPHQHDPVLLMGVARCCFLMGNAAGALIALDRLQEFNPGFQSHDGHLLYARALEAVGRTQEALAEYAALVPLFPGEEARARYAQLLETCGRRVEARELYEAILKSVRKGSGHYRRTHREWNELAKRALAG